MADVLICSCCCSYAAPAAGHRLLSIAPQRIDGSTFSNDFVSSAAVQYAQNDKGISLSAILDYYGTPGECAVYFDENPANRFGTNSVGVHFAFVEGTSGVTFDDYSSALRELRSRCNCK